MSGRTVLVRASTLLGRISRVANAAGTLVVLGLVLIVNFDVVARGVFNAPFRGAVEVVQFSMVLIVFLQLPDVVRVNRLTRSDGLLAVLADKNPRLAAFMAQIIDLVSAIFMGLIVLTVWPDFIENWESGDYFGTPGIFTAPWWPVKLVILLSAGLCCLLWLAKAAIGNRSPEHVHLADGE
jgi:TRAP-type mannitol/chloroaromatic compound transport system permease small subunit